MQSARFMPICTMSYKSTTSLSKQQTKHQKDCCERTQNLDLNQ